MRLWQALHPNPHRKLLPLELRDLDQDRVLAQVQALRPPQALVPAQESNLETHAEEQ